MKNNPFIAFPVLLTQLVAGTLCAGILCAGILCAGTLWGQEVLEDVVVIPRRTEAHNARIYVSIEMFERWVFGDGQNAERRRADFDSQLMNRIVELERKCKITSSQRIKLILAGRADITRFFDELETLRDKFRAGAVMPDGINRIALELRPIQERYRAGIFNKNSVFAKAARTVLTVDQSEELRDDMAKRRQFRYAAIVHAAVSVWDEAVPMTQETRTKLIQLILQETQPPLVFGQLDYYYVLQKAISIPVTKYQSVFDAEQVRRCQDMFLHARAAVPNLSELLDRNGYVQIDETGP